MRWYDREVADEQRAGAGGDAGIAPGKRTLTMGLAPRAVAEVRSQAGETLPHLAEVQRSFGGHLLGDVRSHVGGAAARAASHLGAAAFATGGHIGFATPPTLFTVAHEAAHVVQQRGRGASIQGLGGSDDEHERHADDVAARVVRGESAEALLDRYAPRGAVGGTGGAVQLMTISASEVAATPPKASAAAKALERHGDPYDTKDLDGDEARALRDAMDGGLYRLRDDARNRSLKAALTRRINVAAMQERAEEARTAGREAAIAARRARAEAKAPSGKAEAVDDEVDDEVDAAAAPAAAAVEAPAAAADDEVDGDGAGSEDDDDEPRFAATLRRSPERELPRPRENVKAEAKAAAGIEAVVAAQATGVVDTGKPAADASRLSWLVNAVTRGICAAVMLDDDGTLYVTANADGLAFAQGIKALVNVLEADDPLAAAGGSIKDLAADDPDVDVEYDQDALRGRGVSSAMSVNEAVARAHFADHGGFGKPFGDKDHKAAAPHASRRLTSAAAYFQQVKRVVIHRNRADDVHAEMRLLDGIHDSGVESAKLTLGISKLCCGLCAVGVALFRTLHPGITVTIQGVHGKVYGKWRPPRFVMANLDEFAAMVKAADAKALEGLDVERDAPILYKALLGYKGPSNSNPTNYYSDSEEKEAGKGSKKAKTSKKAAGATTAAAASTAAAPAGDSDEDL